MTDSPSTDSTWTQSDGALRRDFEFKNFVEAFGFVTQVALIAQRHDHHPDITISWNKVALVSTSHDAGSTVTERDHKLVAAVDKLL